LLDGRPVAAAAVEERKVESADDCLATLGAMGLRLILMTGDQEERARAIGLAEVHAALAPDAKQAMIRELRADGCHILMVGDGVNDAPAMAESHVGLAVAGGADLAVAAADALLIEPDLRRIPFAVALARRARRTIRGNLRLAAAYNAAGMGIAAAGLLHPVAAIVLMTCSSLVVTWRALQLLEGGAGESDWATGQDKFGLAPAGIGA
jgi:P-type E1-E2 ATPase